MVICKHYIQTIKLMADAMALTLDHPFVTEPYNFLNLSKPGDNIP
ncbi:MAG: hypothetical protein AB4080_14055 [Trichodesmium sp.]